MAAFPGSGMIELDWSTSSHLDALATFTSQRPGPATSIVDRPIVGSGASGLAPVFGDAVGSPGPLLMRPGSMNLLCLGTLAPIRQDYPPSTHDDTSIVVSQACEPYAIEPLVQVTQENDEFTGFQFEVDTEMMDLFSQSPDLVSAMYSFILILTCLGLS